MTSFFSAPHLLLLFPVVTINEEFSPQFKEPHSENVVVDEGSTAVLGCNIQFLTNQ